MAQQRLFRSGVAESRKALRRCTYIVGYSICVLVDHYFRVGEGTIPFVSPSIGLIFATLVLSPYIVWREILLCSLILELGANLAFQPSFASVDVVILAIVHLGFASAFAWVVTNSNTPTSYRRVMPDQILPVVALLGVPFSMAYGGFWVLYYELCSLPPISFANQSLAVVLGLIMVAPVLISMAYPLGVPARFGVKRIAQILFAIAGVLLLASLGFNQQPAFIYKLVADSEVILLFALFPFLLLLSLRADSITVTSTLSVMAAISGYGLLQQVETGRLGANVGDRFFEAQAIVAVVMTLGIALTVLVTGRRDSARLQRTRNDIAIAILRNVEDSPVAQGAPTDRLTVALRRVGEFANADECRLYSLDVANQQAHCLQLWQAHNHDENSVKVGSTIMFSELPWFFAELVNGTPVTFRHDAHRHPQLPAITGVLGLRANCSITFQPVVLADKAIGCVGLISDYPHRRWHRDSISLLNIIGDFYSDIILRKRAQASLRRYEIRLRELAVKLAEAQEKVRRSTAVELHDGLVQGLAVARMKLGELAHREENTPVMVTQITSIIDELLVTSRGIINELSPSVLYELGLMPALGSLADSIRERHGFRVSLEEHGSRQPLDESIRLAIYHAIQALTDNCIAHSKGINIWIRVEWTDEQLLTVSVCDDGIGTNLEQLSRLAQNGSGLGLMSIRERLRALDYTIEFSARVNGGICGNIRPEKSGIYEELFV